MKASPPELPPLIGHSRSFMELMDKVSKVAPLDRPVLVIGERGTGKELIASRLHFLSRRWDRNFVQLNCAALAETLLETDLFGHEAGAFTGAARQRVGRFELAHRGSLFLDEIANASMQVQEKILRVIEYGTFERVGGNATVSVDVRVIGATNIDLPAAAEAGDFRHDLLDRLSFDVLTIPPLRARRDDVAVLALHFGRTIALELGWEVFPGFAPGAMEKLEGYDWPGNVRELKNVVERAVYRWPAPGEPIGELDFDPFESPYRPAGPKIPRATEPEIEPAAAAGIDGAKPLDYGETVAALEVRILETALAANRHNQRATAKHLGLTYHQLRHQLKKHGLLEGGTVA
ncbi:MAG: phage shock protein operon transcriptional activator [Sphingomonadales bacterium]